VAVGGGNLFIQNDVLVHQSVWSAVVGVRWELFDGGVKRSQASALDQRAEAVWERRSDALSAVELEVRRAWLDTDETTKRVAVTQDTLAQAEESLKVSRDRYAEGVGTNTEVLDAETLRVRSFSNYYDAVYDAVLARMRLHRAVGDL
jgi:outer membrane protein TolC